MSSFPGSHQPPPDHCIVDSTAYFIRADATGREVLIFGDVEPDTLSLSPRTHIVWAEAAPKIASGHLTGILIECSYADSQPDPVLFGHLAPRHLIQELQVLGDRVREARRERRDRHVQRKRKRGRSSGVHGLGLGGVEFEDLSRRRRSTSHLNPNQERKHSFDAKMTDAALSDRAPGVDAPAMDRSDSQHSPKSRRTDIPSRHPHDFPSIDQRVSISVADADAELAPSLSVSPGEPPPLAGLKVIIIHVKDTYSDGPGVFLKSVVRVLVIGSDDMPGVVLFRFLLLLSVHERCGVPFSSDLW